MALDQSFMTSTNMTKGQAALIGVSVKMILERADLDWSVSEVTQRAGVAKGSFYNHFGSKSDMLDVILRQEITNWMITAGQVVQAAGARREVCAALFQSALREELLTILVTQRPKALGGVPFEAFTPLSTQLGICFDLRQRQAYLAARSVIAALAATLLLVGGKGGDQTDEMMQVFANLTASFLSSS